MPEKTNTLIDKAPLNRKGVGLIAGGLIIKGYTANVRPALPDPAQEAMFLLANNPPVSPINAK